MFKQDDFPSTLKIENIFLNRWVNPSNSTKGKPFVFKGLSAVESRCTAPTLLDAKAH